MAFLQPVPLKITERRQRAGQRTFGYGHNGKSSGFYRSIQCRLSLTRNTVRWHELCRKCSGFQHAAVDSGIFRNQGIGSQFALYARLEGPVASRACFTSFYFLARLEFFLRKKRKNLPSTPDWRGHFSGSARSGEWRLLPEPRKAGYTGECESRKVGMPS